MLTPLIVIPYKKSLLRNLNKSGLLKNPSRFMGWIFCLDLNNSKFNDNLLNKLQRPLEFV